MLGLRAISTAFNSAIIRSETKPRVMKGTDAVSMQHAARDELKEAAAQMVK